MSLQLSAPRSSQRRISLTPLIDVVFILLVFFMLETTFVIEGGIGVVSAEPGSSSSTAATEVLLIEIFDHDFVWLNGGRTPFEQWARNLDEWPASNILAVEVRTAPSISMYRLVAVLDRLARRGFADVRLGKVRGLDL